MAALSTSASAKRHVALLLTVFSASWFAVRADDAPEDAVARAQLQQRRESEKCRQKIAELELDVGQARRLIPLLEQAATQQTQLYEQEARLLPEMTVAFAAFAAEDRLNEGFSPGVERPTGKLSHESREAREQYNEQLCALEQQATQILTTAQREKLGAVPSPARGGTLSPRHRRVLATAAKPSATPDAERLAALRQELQRVNEQKHPQPGSVARILLSPAAIDPLCEIAKQPLSESLQRAADAWRNGTDEYPLRIVETQRAEVTHLRKEINNWNLINGLHLDQQQIERIVTLYDNAGPRDSRTASPPRDRRLSKEERFLLENAVDEVLNSGQRQVLADYKACLIPPKNLKDPVRVGQARDDSPYTRWLEKARGKSGPELEQVVQDALTREVERVGEMTKAERQARAVILRRAARQAGKLSDSEFELNKAELAQRIAPPDRTQELHHAIAELARAGGEPGRIAQFMLNPEFIDQLRERARQLAAPAAPKPADLAAGPQAENCDKSCALPKKTTGKAK